MHPQEIRWNQMIDAINSAGQVPEELIPIVVELLTQMKPDVVQGAAVNQMVNELRLTPAQQMEIVKIQDILAPTTAEEPVLSKSRVRRGIIELIMKMVFATNTMQLPIGVMEYVLRQHGFEDRSEYLSIMYSLKSHGLLNHFAELDGTVWQPLPESSLT